MKKLIIILSGTLITFSIIIYMNKEISQSVIINSSIEDVWKYASDSSKANKWSVYFHHISALPGIKDGKIGSVRRCYRRENEIGPAWDEEVIEVVTLKYRQLRTYNLQGFNDSNLMRAEFKVHQRYEKIDENTTKLTFASELIGPLEYSVIKGLLPISDETKRIFKLNLENIKAHIEQGNQYKRIHQFEDENKFDLI